MPVDARLLILSRSFPDVKLETGAGGLLTRQPRRAVFDARLPVIGGLADLAGGRASRKVRYIEENVMLMWVDAADYQVRHFLLLDRDGVINEDHPDYIKHRDEFRFYEDSLDALQWLHHHRIGTIVISNQSGLNRGFISWEAFWDIHACMIDGVREAGGAILGACYCPHRPDEGCSCRKPLPGMLQAAAERFRIPLAETHFIGDKETDLLAARAAGCRAVLLDRVGDLSASLKNESAWARLQSFGSLTEVVLTLLNGGKHSDDHQR